MSIKNGDTNGNGKRYRLDGFANIEIEKLFVDDGSHGFKNPRFEIVKDEEFQSLKESIRENGLLVPLQVKECGERYFIVSGNRRYEATKELIDEGVPIRTMKCQVLSADTSSDKLLLMAVSSNEGLPLTPEEKALAVHTLIDKYGWDKETVAKKFGVCLPTVYNWLKIIDKASEPLKQKMQEGEVTLRDVKKIVESGAETKADIDSQTESMKDAKNELKEEKLNFNRWFINILDVIIHEKLTPTLFTDLASEMGYDDKKVIEFAEFLNGRNSLIQNIWVSSGMADLFKAMQNKVNYDVFLKAIEKEKAQGHLTFIIKPGTEICFGGDGKNPIIVNTNIVNDETTDEQEDEEITDDEFEENPENDDDEIWDEEVESEK